MSRRIAIELDRVLTDVNTQRQNGESASELSTRLVECEPRIVSRLAELAGARQWEILFLTKPHGSLGIAQADAQRWLESKGFALPSVYAAPGSRSRIAAALNLDIVISGSTEDCADVADQSQAKAILIWRAERSLLPEDFSRRFDIATSVGDCLDKLAMDDGDVHETGWLAWARRLLALKNAKT